MTPDDFFLYEDEDAFGLGMPRPRLNDALIARLRQGPLLDKGDIDSAQALAHLIHQEFEAYGTAGGEQLTGPQITLALRTLRAVTERLGIDFTIPWRDFTTFRSYWIREGCANSWQARRDLLERYFEPVHNRLMQLEEHEFMSTLATAVSPHGATGWPKVDAEIRELRRRFLAATTPQDYRAIGTHCVGVLEALGRTVYDPAKHLREGETEPPPDKTKQRLGRYIETAVPGTTLEELRSVATKVIELAHTVKHRETPTRREAGICADAVILLANMLRRLAEPT